jgi:Zn-dependent protease
MKEKQAAVKKKKADSTLEKSFMDIQKIVVTVLFMVPSLVVAFTVHEYMHALVAFHCGDPTAKYEKRLTLNPLVHIEPLWALITVLSMVFLNFCFGRGKPVPVNERYLKNPRWDSLKVALAGPFSNIAMAFLAGLPFMAGALAFNSLPGFFLLVFIRVNIGLGIFNLLPVPSLDGWKILAAFLPDETRYKVRRFEENNPMVINIILFAIILLPITDSLLVVPGTILLRLFTSPLFGTGMM